MDDSVFFAKALAIANTGFAKNCYPAGCVIVDAGGKILASAHSTPIDFVDPTAHGEILALRKACRKLNSSTLEGCILYSTVEPCLMCAKAMVYARISRVVFGAPHKEYGSRRTFEILKANGIGKNIEVRELESLEAENLLGSWLKANSAFTVS